MDEDARLRLQVGAVLFVLAWLGAMLLAFWGCPENTRRYCDGDKCQCLPK